ncbi:MAG TPA: EVE domain-containing protein [Vicinamibacteria bacterium]|nr:EVE domain-containing protein [Vicinamibacteria bacterium]
MWLLKTEPGTYAFDDLEREGRTVWDGVKNPVAQKNLRAMKVGDPVLIYHTGEQKAVVGLAEVARAAYPDPKLAGGPAVVDIRPLARWRRPVTLAEIKAHPAFGDSPLVRQGRLSVVPLTTAQAKVLESLAAGGAR